MAFLKHINISTRFWATFFLFPLHNLIAFMKVCYLLKFVVNYCKVYIKLCWKVGKQFIKKCIYHVSGIHLQGDAEGVVIH